jgi:3-oxoadipate enol-lactonase
MSSVAAHRVLGTFAACCFVSLQVAAAGAQPSGHASNGLHYRLEGNGPTVVLIHAFHMDLREWDDVVAEIQGTRRILRYDVRGHGRSKVVTPVPPSVEDLRSLLDELRITRATLVGLSMGSTIALDFALTHPDRVDRLVLISSGIPGVKLSAAQDFSYMRPILDAVKNGNLKQAADLWWESPLLSGMRALPNAARYRPIVADNVRVWTMTRAPALDPPAGSRLEEVKAPVLLIAGALDPSAVEGSRLIASRVKNAEVVILPNANHMLAIEKPHEVSRLIVGC